MPREKRGSRGGFQARATSRPPPTAAAQHAPQPAPPRYAPPAGVRSSARVAAAASASAARGSAPPPPPGSGQPSAPAGSGPTATGSGVQVHLSSAYPPASPLQHHYAPIYAPPYVPPSGHPSAPPYGPPSGHAYGHTYANPYPQPYGHAYPPPPTAGPPLPPTSPAPTTLLAGLVGPEDLSASTGPAAPHGGHDPAQGPPSKQVQKRKHTSQHTGQTKKGPGQRLRPHSPCTYDTYNMPEHEGSQDHPSADSGAWQQGPAAEYDQYYQNTAGEPLDTEEDVAEDADDSSQLEPTPSSSRTFSRGEMSAPFNHRQCELIVSTMENHYLDLWGGRTREANKQGKAQIWADLLERVNSLAPPIKDMKQVKKRVHDYKTQVTTKLDRQRKHG